MYHIKLLLIIFFAALFAVPAVRNHIILEQPDGLEFDAYIRGDEWNNWHENIDGYTIKRNSNNRWKYVLYYNEQNAVLSELDAHLENRSIPVLEPHLVPPQRMIPPNHNEENPINLSNLNREEFNVPFLLIDYPNMSYSFALEELDDLLNEIGYEGSQGQTGSFKDFYIESSYGQFIPHSTTLGWFTADQDYQNYGDGQGNSGYALVKEMIGNAIDEAEAMGVDWSEFDNDGDGYLDALNVIHAGPGAEEGNSSYIWSHKWNLGSEARYYDGVTIDSYTINPEKQSLGYNGNPGMVHIGVISHEFGHALGLPDLYDTDYSSSGIGNWGVMSGGSWGGNGSSPWYPAHFSAWCKVDLEWVEPILVDEGSLTVTMENVEENPIIYKMEGVENNSEYFLFSNRQAIGFDQNIINSGMMIWHVDESIGGNSNDWHRKVDVEQADGLFELNYGSNSGDPADIWPGSMNKTYFGFDTSPNSTYYSEESSGISVTNIAESNLVIETTFRNLPNLAVNSVDYNELTGDLDNVPNPGEVHSLIIDFFNPSSNTIYDLNMVAYTDDLNIAIINAESSLDDVYAYQSTQNNQGISIAIDENSPLGISIINFYFTGVMGDGTFFDQFIDLPLDINLHQEGFPIMLGSEVFSSPSVVDVNNSGEKEIVIADENGIIRAISSTGNFIEDWEIDIGDEVWGSPAIGDIDLDGEIEIIIASKSNHLYIVNQNGELELDYDAEQFLVATPVITNLDQDDELEVVFASLDNSAKIFAINHDGTSLDNYPININEKVYKGVAIADLTQDGNMEIVVATKEGYLHVFDNTGNEISGFPFYAEDDIRSAPVIADIDFDHDLEILFGDDSGKFYCINKYGNLEFVYQANSSIRTSASIQMYMYQTHIYFTTTNGDLVSLNSDGSIRNGWPISIGYNLSMAPVFSDFNSDEVYEVVITSFNEGSYIIDKDGVLLEHYSIFPGSTTSCSPLLVDIDNDNDVEIIYGYSSGISVVDDKNNSMPMPWNMYRANQQRTGFIDIQNAIILGDVNSDQLVNILDIIEQINSILGLNTLSAGAFISADMNADGMIDILDILQIVNIIME